MYTSTRTGERVRNSAPYSMRGRFRVVEYAAPNRISDAYGSSSNPYASGPGSTTSSCARAVSPGAINLRGAAARYSVGANVRLPTATSQRFLRRKVTSGYG